MDWSESLLGCFNDTEICCCSFICPCIQFGQNVQMLDSEGDCACCCLYGWASFLTCGVFPVIAGCVKRGEIREKYHIEGNCVQDFGTHLCCHFCALAQEGRVLLSGRSKLRKIDNNVIQRQAYERPQQIFESLLDETM